MTNYYINLNTQGQQNTQEKLLNIISNVKENDELVVSVDSDNHSKISNTAKLLNENGFEHITKGNDDGRQLSIIAHLKRTK